MTKSARWMRYDTLCSSVNVLPVKELRPLFRRWRHTSLQLQPLNLAFEPIEIEAEVAADIVIVGEFLTIARQV